MFASFEDRRRRAAVLMVAPAVTFLLLMGIFPLLYSLYLIVHRWVLSSGDPPRFIGLGNLIHLVQDKRFLISLGRTLEFTLVTVSVEFLLGLGVALLLVTRGRTLLRSVVLLPMIIAPTVVGLVWRFMYNDQIGLINFLLSQIGLKGPLWLGDVKVAMWALVLVDVWQWTPFIILILLAGLVSLPTDVEEAAAVDGANPWQMFWHIKLPLLRSAIFVALTFRLMDAVRIFDAIYVLTAGGPNNVTEYLSMYAYKVAFRFFDMGYATALAFVLLVILLIAGRYLMPLLKGREA